MNMQTNRATHEVKELIEVAQALARGDFERKLDTAFQGELGQLAAHIETLRENLKILSPRLASHVHLIPKAGRGIAEISQQAETSVNSILGLVDEMCIDQDTVAQMLGKAADGGAAPDIEKLREIAGKTSASLMSLMSFLSFQDVVRQRAEKVQGMIDMVDEKIRELLLKFNVQVEAPLEEGEGAPGEVGLAPAACEVDQASIDDLFDEARGKNEDCFRKRRASDAQSRHECISGR
jgi:methyl-accepting chemotaxis protein